MAKKIDLSRFECLTEHIVPTGVLALDIVLGGGVERGDMVEFSSSSGVGKCVAPWSIIRTQHGLRRIKDLVGFLDVGIDEVVEHSIPLVVDGKNVKSKGVYRGGISEVISVKTASGGCITGSLTHPVLLDNGEYRKLADIKLGDKLVIDTKPVEYTNDRYCIISLGQPEETSCDFKITEDFARALGFFYRDAIEIESSGDGNNYFYSSKCSDKIDFIRAELSKIAKVISTSKHSITFSTANNLSGLSLLSMLLGEQSDKITGGAKIPWFLWRSPYSVQLAWVLAFLDSWALTNLDGSRSLVFSFEAGTFCKQVLAASGWHCKLENRDLSWYLTGFEHIDNGYVHDEVIHVLQGIKSDVWDLTNSETSTFIADGFIVHNSTTLLQCCANKMIHGKKVAYLDVERGVKRSILNSMGILPYAGSKIGDQFLILSPITYSDLDLILDAVIDAEYDMVILDSLSALQPSQLSDKDVEDATVGVKARLNSQLLCKYKPKLRMSGTNLWIVNQVRMKIGMGWGQITTEESTGGNAMYHYPDIRLRASMGPKLKREENTVNGKAEVVYGNMAKLWSVKNRNERPDIKVPLPVIYGKGISNRLTVRDVLKTQGLLTSGAGGRFKINVCGDTFTVPGSVGVLTWIQENYEKVVEWMRENGLLSIVHSEVNTSDLPIEEIDVTVKVDSAKDEKDTEEEEEITEDE